MLPRVNSAKNPSGTKKEQKKGTYEFLMSRCISVVSTVVQWKGLVPSPKSLIPLLVVLDVGQDVHGAWVEVKEGDRG